MQLTFEARRRRKENESDEILLNQAVDVEGLVEPPSVERPAFIDLYLRFQDDQIAEQQTADPSKLNASKSPPPVTAPVKPTAPPPIESPKATEAPVKVPNAVTAQPGGSEEVAAVDLRFEPQLQPPPSLSPIQVKAPTSVDEFRSQVERATAARPFLPISPARKLGGGGGGKLPTPSKATHVEKPAPYAPRPTPENPVPKPIWEVESAAYQTLPERKSMDLKAREESKIAKVPAPTVPNLDDARRAIHNPVQMDELRKRAKEHKQVTAPLPKGTAPTDANQALDNLYNEILYKDPEEKKVKGTPRLPPSLSHTEEIDPTQYLKGRKEDGKETRADVDPAEAARVWARLLAEPKRIASESMAEIRASMYPNTVVARYFPTVGEEFVPGLESELSKHFRAVAEVSVGNTEKIDAAIEERKKEIAGKIAVAAVGESKAVIETARLTAEQEADRKASLEASVASTKKHADKAKAALKLRKPPETTTETRNRLVGVVREKVAVAMTRFLAMETRRKAETDGLEAEHQKACEFAAQKDELAILAELDEGPDREKAIQEVKTWLELMTPQIKRVFSEYRELDANAMTIFRKNLELASAEAYSEIRIWADKTEGFHISDVQRKQEADADKIAQDAAVQEAMGRLDIEKLAKSANSRFVILGDLKTAVSDEAKKKALIAGEGINNEQRQIVAAVYGPNKADPYELIAKGLLEETIAPKRAKYFVEIKKQLLVSTDWNALDMVGMAIGGDGAPNVAARANKIRNASEGYTSDDDAEDMIHSLEGFNEFSIRALELYYVEKFGTTLESDLKADLDDDVIAKEEGQQDHAFALIKQAKHSVWKGEPGQEKSQSDPNDTSQYVNSPELKAAKAEALAAEIFRHGKGQWGTKEKETFDALGKVKTKEEKELLEAAYLRMYGRSISVDLKEELDDWATTAGHNENGAAEATSHDAARAIALLNLDKERARAIQIDQEAFYDQWGRGDRDDVEVIYKEVEDEVRADALKAPRKNSAWVQAEIKRRLKGITDSYDKMYAGTTLPYYVPQDPKDPNSPLVQARRGTLVQNFKTQFGEFDGEVLVKEAEYDKAGADSARMLAERESLYVSDEVSNKILLDTQERARKDTALDEEPRLRYFAEENLRYEEDRFFRTHGRFWTPRERYSKKKQLDLEVERQVDALANIASAAAIDRLGKSYERISGGETLKQYISSGMSGYDAKYAEKFAEKGYLTPKEQLELGLLGTGTNEELVKRNLKKLSKKEIDTISGEWEHDHGETLWEALDDDLSGDDWIEAQVDYRGRPLSMDDAIAAEKERERLTRPGDFGSFAAMTLGSGADVNDMALNSIARLEALAKYMDDPKVASLTPEKQEAWLQSFDNGVALVNEAITVRNAIVSDVTDSVVNAVSMVVAVVVGALLSPFTGGLSALAAAAVVSSLAATATSVILRRVMMGARYGSGQIALDLAVGVVDALVAALTAGMGNKLLGIRQAVNMAVLKSTVVAAKKGSTKAMVQLMMFKLGTSGRLVKGVRAVPFLEKMAAKESNVVSRFIANGIAQSAENAVQSVPSAIVTNMANEENWKSGNPAAAIIAGIGQQVGMGVAQGMAFSTGMDFVGPAVSKAWNFAKGAELGPASYKTQGSEGIAQQKVREDAIHELHATHPEGDFSGIPVTELSRADYLRMVGIGKPDAAIIIRDGQLHVVVRAGGDPAHVGLLAAEIHEKVEAGTGGRLNEKQLSATLPSSLKNKVMVEVDSKLGPFEIKVVPGEIVQVIVGPKVSAKSYQNHLRVASDVLSIRGSRGIVRQLIEQIRMWTLEHGSPPKDSVAFLAHHEVRKLPREIAIVEKALLNPDLSIGEVATLRAQLDNLNGQLLKHKADLDNLDLAPADGFIAAPGLHNEVVAPSIDPKTQKPFDRINMEGLASKASPVTDSTLSERADVAVVLQMGPGIPPSDPKYRLVMALDENGTVIYAHEERKLANGTWKVRGTEPTIIGGLTETASAAYDVEMLMEKGMADDKVILIQNERGNGFDRVLLKYDISDYKIDIDGKSVLKDDAVPWLTIIEDKSSRELRLQEFTAFSSKSKGVFPKNIKNLQEGKAPSMLKDSGGGQKVKHEAYGTYWDKKGQKHTLTNIDAKRIDKALKAGRFSITISALDEVAFKLKPDKEQKLDDAQIKEAVKSKVDDKQKLADAPIIKRLQEHVAKQEVPNINLKDLEVTARVLRKDALTQVEEAFRQYDMERRITETFPLYKRIVGLTGTGKPTFSPDFYSAAHFVEQLAQARSKSMPDARFLKNADRSPLAIDGVKIITDGTGKSILHIDVQPPSKLLDKMAKSANEILMLMGRDVTDPVAKVSSKPDTILNLTDWKPEQIAKLKTALETAAKGNAAHKKALERISVFPTKSNSIEKLFPPASKKK
jgi:hypothetical protein